MMIKHISLKSWRNFRSAKTALAPRTFVIGPNASGKSNLLDAFRFLHDIVCEGGGLAEAVRQRGGLSRLRSLHARNDSEVAITITVEIGGEEWVYSLGFGKGKRPDDVIVKHERVQRAGEAEPILLRPDANDLQDAARLAQTHLQQVGSNAKFRPLYEFFGKLSYIHLVPQMVREGQPAPDYALGPDPLGRDLIRRMKTTPAKTRGARLKRILKMVKAAVPQLDELELEDDEMGHPHLKALFSHWRPQGAYQDERQFSDGTLRLIALLWALQETHSGPLLLEEPEWSLHTGILRQIPSFLARVQAKSQRQIILTTHNAHILQDEGITAREIVLVQPKKEGSELLAGVDVEEIQRRMDAGLNAAEAALPRTTPDQAAAFGTGQIF